MRHEYDQFTGTVANPLCELKNADCFLLFPLIQHDREMTAMILIQKVSLEKNTERTLHYMGSEMVKRDGRETKLLKDGNSRTKLD